MSLHTGEPVLGEEGYVGIDVHRARGSALQGTAAKSCSPRRPPRWCRAVCPTASARWSSASVHLTDIDIPERVYQLTIDGLQSEFPPLRTKQGEPLDLGESIEQRVEQYVRQSIEEAFAGAGRTRSARPTAEGAEDDPAGGLGRAQPRAARPCRGRRDPARTRSVLGRNGAAPPDPAKGQREHALHAL